MTIRQEYMLGKIEIRLSCFTVTLRKVYFLCFDRRHCIIFILLFSFNSYKNINTMKIEIYSAFNRRERKSIYHPKTQVMKKF